MSFKIIVDSCCDLTPAQLREECFVKVPLTIRVGGHTIVDDDTFDQGELRWRMKESETAPQSACPSPMQYLEAFDCGADDLYVVTLSALLSGSHNAAAQARSIWLEDHPGANVHIFNSCSAPRRQCAHLQLLLRLGGGGAGGPENPGAGPVRDGFHHRGGSGLPVYQ